MFKELICAVALSGTIGMTAPQNSSTDTFYQDVTITETYEYETNEVNSVDDLVVGNIYQLNIPNALNEYTYNLTASAIYHLSANDNGNNRLSNASFSVNVDNGAYLRFVKYGSSKSYSLQKYNADGTGVTYFQSENNYSYALHCEFVHLNGNWPNDFPIEYISASDYLGEHTVTVTPKEFNGLFAIFDNFLHERLFSGGILDTTNVTVFNATMSLGQWLSTTTSIVLLCLIVLLLVLLIKFIFKYVGGMMIWRS